MKYLVHYQQHKADIYMIANEAEKRIPMPQQLQEDGTTITVFDSEAWSDAHGDALAWCEYIASEANEAARRIRELNNLSLPEWPPKDGR